jgi:PAS domain-containing protein
MGLSEQDTREIIRLLESGAPLTGRLRAALLAEGPAEDYGNEALGLFRTHIASGKMQSCNRRAAQILGYADAGECKRRHDAAQSYADPHERERLLGLLRDTGELRGCPVELLRPDGTTVRVRLWSRLDPGAGCVDGALDLWAADHE